jgi:hypothetical protein
VLANLILPTAVPYVDKRYITDISLEYNLQPAVEAPVLWTTFLWYHRRLEESVTPQVLSILEIAAAI